MRAFDLSRADRQIIGQGFAIVQLISATYPATYQIAMASAHWSLVVVHFGRFEMTSECLQRLVEAAGFERVLLRVDPGLLRGGLGRNRFRGVAQILANMIEINQVAALGAKLLLHLAHDPWRSVPVRMNAGIRAEAGPNRAFEKLSSRGFDAALDRARVSRRGAPFGVRQGNLGLSPRQRLAFALVLLAGVRLHNGDHAAIRLSDDILVLARRFRKHRDHSARFEDVLGVAQSDPLDRALSYLEAVMLLQLHPHLSERLIGGKIGDRALQSPRTAPRNDFRAPQERAHAFTLQPISRL